MFPQSKNMHDTAPHQALELDKISIDPILPWLDFYHCSWHTYGKFLQHFELRIRTPAVGRIS